MNYKHIAALFYLSLNSIIFANNKQYDIYIYDTFKGFTITLEENEMSIDPINFGTFLLKENLTYKNQIFNDDNLIVQLLSHKKIEPLDTVWIKNTSILDGVLVDVRFLFSGEEEILSNDKKIMALLYRMDIKTLAAIEDKKNLVNDAVLNSVLRKIWIDKNTGTIIKLSFMYNGISYIINKNEN
ncbi:MAG: hypothetical protein HOK47_02985 [Candidatus Marinimicrobia bacterium]|nr:hypothetical protein [Candidatus Neomarinimicrobiota bacterium]MBT6188292.1 hypothetical protein [Candidatus Neomarinimicrobiota bacterium]